MAGDIPSNALVSHIPPPIHITGDAVIDWIAFLIAYGAVLYFALFWLRALRLARDTVKRVLKNLLLSGAIFFIAASLFKIGNLTAAPLPMVPYLAAIIAFVCMSSVGRSRYIPAAVLRDVKERHLRRTGEKYDPSKHDIDHIWPFVFGGSNTADNLRIVAKAHNRKRGKRLPKLTEMF